MTVRSSQRGTKGELATAPAISIVMANYNGARFIADAIRSVLAQSIEDLELIVADDASSDESIRIVESFAELDSRIVLLKSEMNRGPAAARNRALECCSGEWIAVVDSDDIIHPDRMQILLGLARADGADIVADDLLIFESNLSCSSRTLLFGQWAKAPFWVDAATFIRSNVLYGELPPLGYSKPLVRRELLDSLRYDEALKNGEDYALLRELLVRGARLRVYPQLLYFYRKHASSISHRLSYEQCRAMEDSESNFSRRPEIGGEALAASQLRAVSIRRAYNLERLIASIKARSLRAIVRACFSNPSPVLLLKHPLRSFLGRLKRSTLGRGSSRIVPGVCIISRQRIVGATNGSSAYILSMANFLKSKGFRLHYLSPSPATFGRWPFLWLKPEMAAFDSITIRGSRRIGNLIIANDPRVAMRAMVAILQKVGARLGLPTRSAVLPYAVAAPLTRHDELFLAKEVRKVCTHVIFDYAFLTAARPYMLVPEAPALVVMHDLLSARNDHFGKNQVEDSIPELDLATEMRMLQASDYILAIQANEAETLHRAGVRKPVLLAPMATRVVVGPKSGNSDRLLFVGSKTAANVDGLRWFIDEVWPKIAKCRPTVQLDVVGSVCNEMARMPAGIRLHGIVEDIAQFYEDAGVVVSPLRAGSGLKIKLVEAMGQGKAIVATSVTAQGVEAIVVDAIRIADDASGFAREIDLLLSSEETRLWLGQRALGVARAHFSEEACYGAMLKALTSGGGREPSWQSPQAGARSVSVF